MGIPIIQKFTCKFILLTNFYNEIFIYWICKYEDEGLEMVKMKGRIISLTIILLMVVGSFGAFGTYLLINNDVDIKEYMPGEVIVGFHKQLEVLGPIDVRDIDIFEGHNIKEKIEVLNVAVVDVDIGEEQTFIDSIDDSPFVKYAELNRIVHACYTPNDPRWDAQWGPQRIHCKEAWDSQQGSSSVKIAIVDTGVDYNHEDIAGNYVSGGYDWVNDDDDPWDDRGHGSHCAGIAAAVMNNNKGIAGVAQVSIMAEKVLSSGGSGSASDVAYGIVHAADNGADIISMSLGSSSPSSIIEDACDYAYNDEDVVIVAASGNDYSNQINWPAAYETVIAVGAIDNQDERCSFSNYGEGLELVAPGYRIISSIPGNDYDFYSGTSMACPHVSGVAALAKSTYPSWTNIQIREELKNTAEDLGPDGWDEEFGYGLVDARLSGGGPGEGANVNIIIHQVKGLDALDLGSDPEWYYKVSVDSQTRFEYDGYEQEILPGWWIFVWNERNLWTPDKNYEFFTENPEVTVKVKLMEDDVAFNDIADLSERPSDDFLGGEEGRTFTITYDLSTDEITGDRYESDGTWLYTRGDWDGSTEPEGILTGYKQDDAQLWFKITDDYDPNDYKPNLLVSPTSINFGTVSEGDVVSDKFTVKNGAKEDDPFNPPQDLTWDIENPPSWISVSPVSGSLEPGDEESVTVEIDTTGMEHKTWSGKIKVTSNGGTQDVTITITVPRVRPRLSLLYSLFEVIQSKFPLLLKFLENLPVFQR